MADAKKSEHNPAAKVGTTGHEWDGIQELNTPLPRWWLWLFYADDRVGDQLLDRLSGVAAGLLLHLTVCSTGTPAAPSPSN